MLDQPGENSWLSARPWLLGVPAALVAMWNIVSAPFLTKYLVEPVRDRLGADRFVVALLAVVAVLGVATVAAGWIHLKEERWRRIALVSFGLVLVAAYIMMSDRGIAAVAVVEHLHFVTYGSLAALLVVPMRRLRAAAPLGGLAVLLIVAILDEGVQWLVPVRTGEMFDIGLNLYAGAAGFAVGMGLFSVGLFRGKIDIDRGATSLRLGWRPEHAEPTPHLPSARVTAKVLGPLLSIVVVLIASFVQLVHLGHEIRDPEIGTFRSFFSLSGLAERNRDAASVWLQEPPGALTPFEKEDWFRTEAVWHVTARNVAQSRENWRTATAENAVLEKYYPAILLLTGSNGEPFALTEFDTAAIAGFAAEAPLRPAFESQADNGRIWLWPSRTVLWPMATLCVIGLLGWSARSIRASEA